MPGLPERQQREVDYAASMIAGDHSHVIPAAVSEVTKEFEKLYGPVPENCAPVLRAINRHNFGVVRTKAPSGVFILAGVSGSGKTFFAQCLSEALHRRKTKNCIFLNGADFEPDTSVLKILGAPPTYMGHRETPPLFSPKSLSDAKSDHSTLTVVIWDEIERMNRRVRQLFLSIMDEENGTINLGDNTNVSFRDTLHFITTNLGTSEYETAGNFGITDSRVNLRGGIRRRERVIQLLEKKLDSAVVKRIHRLGGMIEFPKLDPAAVEGIVYRKTREVVKAFNDSPFITAKVTKTHIYPRWIRDFMAKYDFDRGIREGLAGLTTEVVDVLLAEVIRSLPPEATEYHVKLETLGKAEVIVV